MKHLTYILSYHCINISFRITFITNWSVPFLKYTSTFFLPLPTHKLNSLQFKFYGNWSTKKKNQLKSRKFHNRISMHCQILIERNHKNIFKKKISNIISNQYTILLSKSKTNSKHENCFTLNHNWNLTIRWHLIKIRKIVSFFFVWILSGILAIFVNIRGFFFSRNSFPEIDVKYVFKSNFWMAKKINTLMDSNTIWKEEKKHQKKASIERDNVEKMIGN